MIVEFGVRRSYLILLASLPLACANSVAEDTGVGPPVDTGVDTGVVEDAQVDTGVPLDAAEDTGIAPDTGVDGGNDEDTGASDAMADSGVDLLSDLVLHYVFDGDATDLSDNGHDGTIIGATRFVPSPTDQALYFENPVGGQPITEWVEIPDLSAEIQDSFSVAICYTSTDTSLNNGRLFGNWATQKDAMFIDYNAQALPQAHSGFRSLGVSRRTSNEPGIIPTTDGMAHCQVMVVDRAVDLLKEFVDEVATATAVDISGVGNPRFNGLAVGSTGWTDSYGSRFTAVDELRIYNRALTGPEVAELAQSLR